jgi:hypothetical protein
MGTIRLPTDFKEFLQFLNSEKVEYLLVGGHAKGFHGYPRATGTWTSGWPYLEKTLGGFLAHWSDLGFLQKASPAKSYAGKQGASFWEFRRFALIS